MTQQPVTALDWAHPLVRDWFISRFGSPTEPQEQGWPHILAGRTTLISAPTGSGKTLAAFLACIDGLVRKAVAGNLHNKTEVVYVSPLKALSNDIHKNLEVPLREIQDLAIERNIQMAPIRSAVRTGDTLTAERQAMLKKPPHILVTTPESLYILVTSEKSRANLKDVKTIIVDEIHAVADDKRGAHLTLTLERLEHLCKEKPNRIGLSATQKPIEAIGHFLTGSGRPDPVIVNVGHKRKLDIAIEVPGMPLGPIASNELWDEMYDRIAQLVEQHRSTIVFINTRKEAERMAMHLSERLGEEFVAAHHGSLSRKLRLNAEHRLKNGELKVLAATASLELGIDVGHVDLVVQVGSPRAIAVALQRVGRAGHWRGAIPKGRFYATTRDELLECAGLVKAIKEGDLDKIMIPSCPLDILAQQIVAACACEEWEEDDLFDLVRRADPYKDLDRQTFEDTLYMLSEGYAGRSFRFGAYVYWDRVNKRLRARRGARLTAITSGGAIPETGMFTVVAEPEGNTVGTLDEDFAVESNKGDIVLLGNTSWRIRRVESASSRVLVEDAHGAPPTVPFWRGEAPGRTTELSNEVAIIRQTISDMLPTTSPINPTQAQPAVAACASWLKENCGLDDSGAEQAIEYILEGRAVLGAVPTQKTVIAERFFDESGGMQLIIHAPFGARVNKAWGLALRKRFCRSFNFELQAAATNDGLNISLSEQHSFPLADVFQFLSTETVQEVLEQAALQSPIFNTRFRWDAGRALALLRYQGGKKVPPQIQRMRAEDLMASVFPQAAACQDNIDGDIEIPDHPLVREVMKDVLTEAMDLDGLKDVLNGISSGAIKTIAVDTPVPSQFSHEILNANPYAYLDDAPLEERRARAVQMRRMMPESVLQEVGRLDNEAIDQVRDEAWPDIRDADELHDVLQTFIALPPNDMWHGHSPAAETWAHFFKELTAQKRASVVTVDERVYWVPADRAKTFLAVFPQAKFSQTLPDVERHPLDEEAGMAAIVKGWLTHSGPVAPSALSAFLGLPLRAVDQALLRVESTGSILRGTFTQEYPGETEWCERRLLARIHRLTLGKLRKQIEPVTASQFMRWLLNWQHVAPGSQTTGERGLLEVLKQLQGFEVPANAWERQILAKRVNKYSGDALDKLCMTGAVGWGRLSPHPATIAGAQENPDSGEGNSKVRRVIPTSVAPITFFVREESDWMMSRHGETQDARGLSHAARQAFDFLRLRGASFFTDIVRATGQLKSETETALWELVTAGLITADGFDNLRSLIDPRRRAGQGSGRASRPRHAAGRWTQLYAGESTDRNQAIEATCWMLLKRYGIVFRDVIAREELVPKWRELLMAFRRLEDRGEIRGGRFVSGFIGEQFALPIAVESVRAMRKKEPTGEIVTISAADPLNLVGIIVPGDRIPAVSSKTVIYRDGVPISEDQARHAVRLSV
jgi:ATP-dependent helicase Lhr and Lhr-like helicase